MTGNPTRPMFRMPMTFGPSLGPRQGPNGEVFTAANDHRTRSLVITAASDIDALQALLPDRFEAAEPVLTITVKQMRDIEWLAGRGYNIVLVTIPVTYQSRSRGHLSGDFVPVLWENMCDPILTGREDMGYPKLFADITDIDAQLDSDRTSVVASWDGFPFFEATVTNLVESDAPPTQSARAKFVHKYYPATQFWGQADVDRITMTPPEASNTVIDRHWTGTGSFAFHSSTWEQLPTLVTVVNGLADIPMHSFTSAAMTTSTGGVNYRKQVCLD